jgi:hypothetical protein
VQRRSETVNYTHRDGATKIDFQGTLLFNVNPAEIKPVRLDRKVPLELYEAPNAVQIARWTGAQQYAPETYQKAVQGLQNGEGYLKRKAGTKPIVTVAREAVQMAEDARIITVKGIQEEQLANERQAGADREMRAEKERAAPQSETERVAREAERARVTARAEAERLRQDNDARTAAAQNETDRLRRENDAQRAAAQADLDRAVRERAQAETEKTAMRAQLLAQFNGLKYAK